MEHEGDIKINSCIFDLYFNLRIHITWDPVMRAVLKKFNFEPLESYGDMAVGSG